MTELDAHKINTPRLSLGLGINKNVNKKKINNIIIELMYHKKQKKNNYKKRRGKLFLCVMS